MVGVIFSASSVKVIFMLMAIKKMKIKMVNRINMMMVSTLNMMMVNTLNMMMVKAHFANAVCMKKAGKRLAGLLSRKELLSFLSINFYPK